MATLSFVLIRSGSNLRVIGGNKNDSITLTGGTNVIQAGGGNDIVRGGTGKDTIDGGSGNDLLYGGNGDDVVSGGLGNDIVHGDNGNDILDGGAGNDFVFGDAGNDTLNHSAGENVGAKDYYDGGSGIDTLNLTFDTTVLHQLSTSLGYANTSDYLSAIQHYFDSVKVGAPLNFSKFGLNLVATQVEKLAIHIVQAPNEVAPTALSRVTNGTEDHTYIFKVADFGFSDPNPGDTLHSVRFNAIPSHSLGDLLLNGTAVVAGQVIDVNDIQLGKLQFIPAADGNGTTYANFSFQVNDGFKWSDNSALVNLNVAAVNDAPVAHTILNQSANEDSSFIFKIPNDAFTDVDILTNADTLSYTATLANGSPLPSWLHFDGSTGTFSGTPDDPDITSGINIKVTAQDLAGATASSNFNLAVVAVNEAPVAVNDLATTNEDTPITIDVLANDHDPDNAVNPNFDPLTIFSFDTEAAHGNVTQDSNGHLVYTPDPNFNGTDFFTYVLKDAGGLTSSGIVTVNVSSVNDAPFAAGSIGAQTVQEDHSFSLSFANLFNDVDITTNGDALTYSISVNGTPLSDSFWLKFDPDAVTLSGTPDDPDIGTNSVTITATDQEGLHASVNFDLTVTAFNEAPVAVNDAVTTNEDTPITIDVLANDHDPDNVVNPNFDPLTIVLPTGTDADHGSVTLDGNGHLVYTPDANFNGTDSFTYTLKDAGGLTSTGTVTVDISPVNDAPFVVSGIASQSAEEDHSFSLTFTNVFSDVDIFTNDDALTYSISVNGTPLSDSFWLKFDPDAVTLSGTPDDPDIGTNSVTITATDQEGLHASVNFDLTVTAFNEAPVAVNDAVTTNEDIPITIDVLANDHDPDNAVDPNFDPLTIVLPTGTDADHGSVTLDGNGHLVYTPDANFNGTDSFTYTLKDAGGLTSTGTVTVDISSVNDAPVSHALLTDQQETAGQNFTFNLPSGEFTDVDIATNDDALTYTATLADGSPLPSWLSIDNETGTFTGTNPVEGNYTVTVVATDQAGQSANDTFQFNIINPGPTSLFTQDNDTVDFLAVNPGQYTPSTYYDALGGDDLVALPTAQWAAMIGYDPAHGFSDGLGSDKIFGDNLNDIFLPTSISTDPGVSDIDTFDGGAGINTISYENVNSAVNVDLNITDIQDTLGAGQEVLSNFQNITGSAYSDTLIGSEGDNVIKGGAGDDTLTGNGGDDLLEGGLGNDDLDGGSGNDTASYANSTEAVHASLLTKSSSGSEGNDSIIGIENLIGSNYDDALVGDAGNNIITGGLGDDFIDGQGGNDTVSYLTAPGGVSVTLLVSTTQDTGSAGMDTIVNMENIIGSAYSDTLVGDANNNIFYQGAGGNDTITGGAGSDTVNYQYYTNPASSTGVTVSLLFQGVAQDTGAGFDNLNSIENLTGSAYNDTLSGDDNNNILDGGLGNDTLMGNGGSDTATYASASGPVTIDLSQTDFQDTGSAGFDKLVDIENLMGSSFDDNLYGDVFDNILNGGAGNDIINADVGYDTIIWSTGNDKIDGGWGIDTMDFSTYTSSVGAGILVNLTLFSAQDDTSIPGNNNSFEDTLHGIDNVIGTAYNDTLIGNEADNVLSVGTGGQDFVDGGIGNDTVDYSTYTAGATIDLNDHSKLLNVENVNASRFDDTITGDNNNNILYGNDGQDAIFGGAGDDLIIASTGKNYLFGGHDLLSGGDGTDTVSYRYYTSPDDSLTGVTINLQLPGLNNVSDTLNGFENIEGSALNDTLTGDLGANTLSGGDGNDILYGSAGDIGGFVDGNDALYGGAGNDTLVGGSGDDYFESGTGNNTVEGDDGNDFMMDSGDNGWGQGDLYDGGSGSDTVSYQNAAGSITVTLSDDPNPIYQNTTSAGFDAFVGIENLIGSISNDILTGNSQNNTIEGLAGDDILDGSWGIDTVSYEHAPGNVRVDLNNAGPQDTINAGLDIIHGFENIIGSNFNDLLIGNDSDNVIEGKGGDDTLAGGNGGNDTASYASATSAVVVNLALQDGFSGQDTQGAGIDNLLGFENLLGSKYDDSLIGDSNNNILNGADGDDTLDGGAGDDTLIGGTGTNVLNGGTGTNIASYATAASGVTVSLALGAWQQQATGVSLDTLSNIQGLTGSDFDDFLYGNANDNIFDGGKGNDSIDGADGNDTVSYLAATSAINLNLNLITPQDLGNSGIDTIVNVENVIGTSDADVIIGTNSDNVLDIGTGTGTNGDILSAQEGNDTASFAHWIGPLGVDISLDVQNTFQSFAGGRVSLADFENLTGSSFNDNLTGNNGNNTLIGLAGNDNLYGGNGNDLLDGGAGNNFLDGGNGNDTITFVNASYPSGVDAELTASGGSVFNVFGTTFANIENITGTNMADTLKGNELDNILIGLNGNDNIFGNGGNDFIDGGKGTDNLDGGTGNDTITFENSDALSGYTITLDETGSGSVGGTSYFNFENVIGTNFNDTINGNSADNVLQGGAGNDIISAGAGNDILYGNSGDDILHGLDGNDILLGGMGTNTIDGGNGIDTASYADAVSGVYVDLSSAVPVSTGVSTDSYFNIENLIGSAFNDELRGSSGNNVLDGGDGNDILRSQGGTDTLIGGKGNDTLWGDPSNPNNVTAQFSGPSSDYDFDFSQYGSGIVTITDTMPGRDGVDVLHDVGMLQFSDLLAPVTDFVPS